MIRTLQDLQSERTPFLSPGHRLGGGSEHDGSEHEGSEHERSEHEGSEHEGSEHEGLKVLHPRREETNPTGSYTVDVVAIHGLHGIRLNTWTSPRTDYCWLTEAIPKHLSNVRVLTFGYSGSPEDAAEDLLEDLIRDRTTFAQGRSNPIIFITHSFGGIVAKKAFLSSHRFSNERSQMSEVHKSIKGFLFLGMDHYTDMGSTVLRLLKRPSEALRSQILRINHDFAARGGEQLQIACFYERLPFKPSYTQFGCKVLVPKENATLSGVQKIALTKAHVDLARFDSEDDNCEKIIYSLKYIHQEVQDPIKLSAPSLQEAVSRATISQTIVQETEETSIKATGLRLLSLDGGGVRGLFGVIVLEAIMEKVRQYDYPDDPDALRPCDYFDFVGGTSTGGLLAIMLGRLRMDLVSCRLAYKTLSAKIFRRSVWRLPLKDYVDAYWGNPWFSGNALEQAVREVITQRLSEKEKKKLEKDRIVPAEAPLGNRYDTKCKTFVCAVIDGNEEPGCERLRTYDGRGAASHCSIWEACRATSAAPLYFPTAIIAGRKYWDGGVISNNPIEEVYDEATQEHPDRPVQVIVSIGTGKPANLDPGQNAQGIMQFAVKRMTDTQAKHLKFKKKPKLHGKYFRFNEESELYGINMADWKKLDKVEELAYAYVTSPKGKIDIEECAKRLAKSKSVDVRIRSAM